MSELKPCPFCGNELPVHYIAMQNRYVQLISCPSCYATISCNKFLSDRDALATWNTRPIEDALQAENKQIKEDLQHEKTRSQLNLEAEERRMLNITYYCAEIDRLNARIAELEAAQRWRVVADGELPEVGEEVFVCDESGHSREDWLVCKQIDGVGETLFYSAAYDYDPPTHWMPLPKLPEVQE